MCGYDGVYRLTSFERGALNANKDDITSPDRSQTWSLDPLGNWDSTVNDATTETRTHNTVNELTARTVGQDPQISLTYDDGGQPEGRPGPMVASTSCASHLIQDGSADGDHQYVWDYRDRLIEVKEYQTDTWNTTAEYKYDARNRRIMKGVTNKGDLNGTTRFLWGGESDWQCLEERDGSGDLVARYTYAPGYVDDVAVQERDLNDDQDFGDANEVVYYHQNTLFSVYALTDGSENVVERYRYDAYGGCAVLDSDGSADSDGISDVGNAYAFTGRRLDVESDLMQYRNRNYALTLGRFASRDPAGYADDFNAYSYALGSPIVNRDPMGLEVTPIKKKFYIGWTPGFGITPPWDLPGPFPIPVKIAIWEGGFVWSCVEGHEQGDIDEQPGWSGFTGGGQDKWGVGAWFSAEPSQRNSWEECTCEDGKPGTRFVIGLTVYFKKRIGAVIGVPWKFDQVDFDKTCPCRPIKDK